MPGNDRTVAHKKGEPRDYKKLLVNKDGDLLVDTAVDENAVGQEVNTVGTTIIQLVFPEGADSFTIFHQHDTAKVYFGDSSVSSSGYPYLEFNDSLNLDVNDKIELFMISDTADIEVFILGEIKE